jgi:hypothetical protein
MTREAELTESEWALLSDLPRLAAFGAMAADEGDAITATRELWAGMMELAQAAHSRYTGNALIQEIAQASAQDDDGADVSRSGWKPGSAPLGEAVIAQALETARAARPVLAERVSTEEAAEYAAWVLGIARAATEAARTGLFGLGGEQVTAREAAFLRDLQAALEGS